jgi:hypothetical protein
MMTESKGAPILALRMKPSKCLPSSDGNKEDLMTRVIVMIVQENSSHYRCGDYLQRRKLVSDEGAPAAEETTEVDTLCREKMCEWSYRVVDHFHASRDIVGIAFNYLDRFVDKCSCDRFAFKLASMTCLYMATKLFHCREISMSCLAELSRGEFDAIHIAEMEVIILQTLNWRLHAPTSQCFINQFQGLLPTTKQGPATRAIYQRAMFFGELSLFDYCFVSQPRSAVAIAAILNAMEGMDEHAVSREDHVVFLAAVKEAVGVAYVPELIDSIRNRLWYVYSQSAQYQEDEDLPTEDLPHGSNQLVEKDVHPGGDQSPISVTIPTSSR